MKKKLSKKGKLYLVNGIFLVLAIIFGYVDVLLNVNGSFRVFLLIVFKYILIQCAFTLMTLIVYYLSIMADALDRGYKKEKDKESKEDKK